MADVTNPYFNYHGGSNANEADLLARLTRDQIEVTGLAVKYLPRTLQKLDIVFGEDTISKFETTYDIPVRIENYDNWEGEGDFYSKFGISMRDEITFSASPSRFTELTGMLNPLEGDLIHFPYNNGLFEITFVEKDTPWFPNAGKPQIVIQAKSFEFSRQTFDTGDADIDSINAINDILLDASDEAMDVWQANYLYAVGDKVIPSIDNWTGTYFETGTAGTSDATEPDWTAGQPIVDGTAEWVEAGKVNDNDVIESESDSIQDFDVSNPFGMV